MPATKLSAASKPKSPGKALSRRDLLKAASCLGLMLGGGGLLAGALVRPSRAGLPEPLRDARYWVSASADQVRCLACHTAADGVTGSRYEHTQAIVQCQLCAQNCVLKENERGRCRARMNVGGRLKTLVYGRPVSVHVDPIEKKPFYHFLPGAAAFSLASAGCPLSCRFCQNWEISQARPEDFPGPFIPPEKVAEAARQREALVVAYTYNEPTVFTEYLIDIARAGRPKGLRNVMISCGFMNPAPLGELLTVLDAIKIDLKGYSPDFYRRVCGARLEPVLASIRKVAKSGVHLEIVNLVVPTLNDSKKMLADLAAWVMGEAGPDVPVHFTRFHPDYQMRNLPPTPVDTLERAYDLARTAGLHYPYVGNVPGHPGNNTHCPNCGKTVIARTGFFVTENHIIQGRCAFCRTPIAGVWS